jgi:hypothetical protein
MQHREIAVKVNAWVDEGVAPLVTALNEVRAILTLDSCQEDPDGIARVTFCTHRDETIQDAMNFLADVIDAQGWADKIRLSLWAGCDDAAMVAELHCPPELVPALGDGIRSSADRMNRFSRDRTCTELRSWTVRRCHQQTPLSGDGTQRPYRGEARA